MTDLRKLLEALKNVFALAINNPLAAPSDREDIERTRKHIKYIEQDIYGLEE